MSKVDIIHCPGAAHQTQNAEALRTALSARGFEVSLKRFDHEARAPTVAVWGWRKGEHHRRAGRQVIVMERGYLGDRLGAISSIALNGLNGLGIFREPGPHGRLDEMFPGLYQPWNPGGDYILLIGQTIGDASLYGKDLAPWYAKAAQYAEGKFGLPVNFRQHPNMARKGIKETVPGTVKDPSPSLAQAIAGARIVITYNSNSGVDAMMAGKPVIAMGPGAMVAPVACPDVFEAVYSEPAGRRSWAEDMAWKNFTLDEISAGLCFDEAMLDTIRGKTG